MILKSDLLNLTERLDKNLGDGEEAFFKDSSLSNHLRHQALEHASPRSAAVLLLFYPNEASWDFPVIHRSEYIGAHSNQIALPGGKLEKLDANLQETALRETEEEIGVPKSMIKVLGELSTIFIPHSNFLVHPFIGISNQKPDFQLDKREVKKIISISTSSFLALEPTHSEVPVNGKNIKAPGFKIDNEFIWGATASILSEFRNLYAHKDL